MSDIKDIWLYANNIIRSSRQMINEGLNPLNLSSAEGNILLHLFTQSHGVRQDDIVGQLDISKPAVSRALESLEKKGYVNRHRDSSDRRASRVLLTVQAQEIRPKIEFVYNEVYAKAAQGVSEAEASFFINLFCRVSENFYKARSAVKSQRGQDDVE
ncbi:MAG: MarR family winged helix-turn-helix transcriptional regulator [Bacillota bacterium]|nr:MarR family winged helix-turn-helix transcriptional regulator [Bacillota bacterium]